MNEGRVFYLPQGAVVEVDWDVCRQVVVVVVHGVPNDRRNVFTEETV